MFREFHLADWFTLANAVCGMGALFSMLTYLQTNDAMHVYFACGMLLAALGFNILDGRIARWRQQTSAIGRELDSLADVISFGVAPAVIAYGCGMQGLYDRVVLVYFVACGVSRLARYNITAEELSEGGRQSEIFRGNSYPNIVTAGDFAGRGCVAGCAGRVTLVRACHVCWVHASFNGSFVRGLGLTYG